jgi:hypothetical protein
VSPALRRRSILAAVALVATASATACSSEPNPSDGAGGQPGGAGQGGSSGNLPAAGMSGSLAFAGSAGSGGAAAGSAGSAAGGDGARAGGAPTGGNAGTGANGGAAGSVAGGGQGGGASGGGGTSAGVSGAGSGGMGSSGSAGSAGGTAGGAGAAGSAGAAAGCANGTHAICVDFEDTADGAVPSGWTKVGDVGTVSDVAHGGGKSLKIGAAASGARRMRLTGAPVTMLAGTHWGRIFYKVQTPAPKPASGVIHSTIVAWDAMSPVSGTNEVRVVDTVEDAQGRHQYLYNVQTSDRGEFGKGSSYDYTYDGAWYCAEWYVDYATQRYRFFLDGDELESIGVMNGAGNFTNSELPSAFTALSVGWNNYQQAPSPGFVAWIDDVALGSERIGCN